MTAQLSLAARAYQLEMYEASVKRNVVVVMETGTGKTYVALLRIRHALETAPSSRLVWFLAPKVPLAEQQFKVIAESFPMVPTKLLVGRDNVDRWRTQEIWDKVLHQQRIIVSTPKILSDALCHGFVTISRLSLIVFDEAHHCTKGDEGRVIMEHIYRPALAAVGPKTVPDILGLTASPIKTKKISLDRVMDLEKTLNATCVSPYLHRMDLRKTIHVPQLVYLRYGDDLESKSQSRSQVNAGTNDLTNGRNVATAGTDWDPQLLRTLSKHRLTIIQIIGEHDQARFNLKLNNLRLELGSWAAQLYVELLVAYHASQISTMKRLTDTKFVSRIPLVEQIVRDNAALSYERNLSRISSKFRTLINFIHSLSSRHTSSLIFVEQRVMAIMLQKLLSTIPSPAQLTYGHFLGSSDYHARKKRNDEPNDGGDQNNSLQDFRHGKCNVLIATDVLDEGIDVPICNLIICFDMPKNLKSFIQKRGRARYADSRYVFLQDATKVDYHNFEEAEREQKRICDELQKEADRLEGLEMLEEFSGYVLRSSTTEARLPLAKAKEHLHHFCAVLPRFSGTDRQPIYTFITSRCPSDPNVELLQAEVILPNCLPPSLQRIKGTEWWRTERMASREAAFQAYSALYAEGLLNENLLPLSRRNAVAQLFRSDSTKRKATKRLDPDKLPSHEPGAGEDLPWSFMAISIDRPGKSQLNKVLGLSVCMPVIPTCELFWTANTTYTCSFNYLGTGPSLNVRAPISEMQQLTYALLYPVHRAKMQADQKDFATLILPSLSEAEASNWRFFNEGNLEAGRLPVLNDRDLCIVRYPGFFNAPHLLTNLLDGSLVEAKSVPRKSNYLKPKIRIEGQNSRPSDNGKPANVRLFPRESCVIEKLSPEDIEFAVLVPSILHHIGTYYLATCVAEKVLRNTGFSDLGLVAEALTAPSAGGNVNYQRLEHMGDCVLGFLAALHLYSQRPYWHEGLLTTARSEFVSNQRLANAAYERGLEPYITTKPFAPRNWKPNYIDDVSSKVVGDETELLPVKVVADVVEALIGAAYQSGGIECAARCVHCFLPLLSPDFHDYLPKHIDSFVSESSRQNNILPDLQELIGHTFKNSAYLLEAITHPSCIADFETMSYERLEFLGDALLDLVVTRHLMAHTPQLDPEHMHLIRSALANGDFQAFLCLELSLQFGLSEQVQHPSGDTFTFRTVQKSISLLDFMRKDSQDMTTSLVDLRLRYNALADPIRKALSYGKTYPWTLLAELHAPKYASDIVESVAAAILIDCECSEEGFEAFAQRLGLFDYAQRFCLRDMELRHPRTILTEMIGHKGKLAFKFHEQEESTECPYRCEVSLDEVVLAEASGAYRKVLISKVSELAIARLRDTGAT